MCRKSRLDSALQFICKPHATRLRIVGYEEPYLKNIRINSAVGIGRAIGPKPNPLCALPNNACSCVIHKWAVSDLKVKLLLFDTLMTLSEALQIAFQACQATSQYCLTSRDFSSRLQGHLVAVMQMYVYIWTF